MKKILFIFIGFVSFLYASKPELTVNILPQKYFVQKIVKDKFEINVMVKPGTSPHNFEPKPSQMKSLVASKAYFLIGDPSEKNWIDKFKQNAKNTLFVDTTIGVEKIEMQEHKHNEDNEHKNHEHKEEKHNHKKHDKHNHTGLDPHIWLDPSSVKIQAKNIYEAMIKIDSANSEFYKTNYEEFLKELDTLDTDIKTLLSPHKHRAFMVFHPSWGYFAKRYELEQISIEIQGKEPKPNELVELIEESKKHDIKIVFVSPQFSQKSAQTISKNIGADVIAIDPLSDNWSENLLNVAKQISNSYK